MIAVDTNILVRLLTNDDAGQVKRAVKLMGSDEIFVPKTVFIETEWVLRHAYGIKKEAVMESFNKILGLPNVTVEDPTMTARAISWCMRGVDFADALHLASSHKADRFATFDAAFVKKAEKVGLKQMIKL